MRNDKVLSVIPSMAKGGAERVLSLLSSEWSKGNYLVNVVFDNSNPSYTLNGDVIDLKCLAKNNLFIKMNMLLIRAIKLYFIILKQKPNAIFSFMETANIPSVIACFFSRTLSQLTVSIHNDPRNFPLIFRFLMKLLYPKAGRIVCVSQGIANVLIDDYQFPKGKVKVIYNPVSIQDVSRKSNDISFENRYGDYIVAVGRLHYQKGFDRLIRALYFSQTKLNLVILGEGELLDELKEQVEQLGLSKRVFFVGWRDNPFVFFRHAKLFVLSSRYEGFGNVIVEALASHCPVISYDCNFGPNEIICDRFSGLLVDEGEIEKLASAIDSLYLDAASRKNLIERGYTRSLDFDVNIISKEWLINHD